MLTLDSPSGFEPGTPGPEIQRPNQYATPPLKSNNYEEFTNSTHFKYSNFKHIQDALFVISRFVIEISLNIKTTMYKYTYTFTLIHGFTSSND